MMRLILWMCRCKFCRFFYGYIPSKQFPGKGFGECNNPRLQSSAWYDKDGHKMQFYVANYFGCHLFRPKKLKHLLKNDYLYPGDQNYGSLNQTTTI